MESACTAAGAFLESLFQGTGLNIRVAVNETQTECLLDLSGPDASCYRSKAENFTSRTTPGQPGIRRRLADGQRLVCDVEGFRATREAELRAMANLAADRVRSTSAPFVFGEMNSSERRIIHLTLADCETSIQSRWATDQRKLRVALNPRSDQRLASRWFPYYNDGYHSCSRSIAWS